MRIHKVFVPLLATAALGLAGVAISGCQAEADAQIGATTPPPPPPAPPPPAPPPPATTAEAAPPPPPPAAPPKAVVHLKGVAMKSATQIDMPGDIEFTSASAKINMNAKSKKVLTQLATILKDNPEITKLNVEGNTDNEGENKGFDNVKLSQERAQAIVDYLAKQGIDSKRLNALGNGSKNPLAPNDTKEHKAENRRVEFHVLEFNGQAIDKEAAPAPAAGATANGPAGAAMGAGGAGAAPATPSGDAKGKDKAPKAAK